MLPKRHSLLLTGTPVANDLTGLHSLLELAAPGGAPSARSFGTNLSSHCSRRASGARRASRRARSRSWRVRSSPTCAIASCCGGRRRKLTLQSRRVTPGASRLLTYTYYHKLIVLEALEALALHL
jgi:hypothetical protein